MQPAHGITAGKPTLRCTLADGLIRYVRLRNQTSRGPHRRSSLPGSARMSALFLKATQRLALRCRAHASRAGRTASLRKKFSPCGSPLVLRSILIDGREGSSLTKQPEKRRTGSSQSQLQPPLFHRTQELRQSTRLLRTPVNNATCFAPFLSRAPKDRPLEMRPVLPFTSCQTAYRGQNDKCARA